MKEDLAKVKNCYADVQSVLEGANNDIKAAGKGDKDTMGEIGRVKKSLNTLTGELQVEIDELEKSSEWDKLCIAFFGETNAGKSTIIDALRILYDEDSRHAKIQKAKEELEKAYEDSSKSLASTVQKIHNIKEAFKRSL